MQVNLSIDLVRTFVTVVDCGNITQASKYLLRGQSAISMQIKRLEDLLGKKLLTRSKSGVVMTGEGERFLPDARELLKLNDDIYMKYTNDSVAGTVRIGAPEDFATSHLPQILSSFSNTYPNVALEVTCELTMQLLDDFGAGKLDLALVKQDPDGSPLGMQVWREPLVWVASDSASVSSMPVVPLACAPNPCVYRERAITGLKQLGREWREAYICTSLSGIHAAVRAGLGIGVLPKEMVPSDLRIVNSEKAGLPMLRATEMALIEAKNLSKAAERLREYIIQELEHK
ncbi:LysR substrate-binding domain-containing protein [Kordiimonas sp. SCSIO 12610]|uniref:LysR substrate-binding domain-containing protein n=1 Tax=Kordiimonas sp. SCSIO 12610 TaxID=2829597 RepID=UPI00210B60CE|nr:LysR substrate-binding domain-containing protein [Kordiimonas sp. SCSIO 12610]UTW56517.1 LysR family transcriptional regulator [Kordiimonas sp. SCSIO 12610]